MRNFKMWLLVQVGVCKPKHVHEGDIYMDWCEAEAYNDEHDLLYKG